MIWLAFTLMTTATVLALVWPLASRRMSPRNGAADVRFYVDLLQDVDRDIAGGLVSPAEAETTRAELGRRLLGAVRSGGAGAAPAGGFTRRRLVAAVAAVLLVPAFSLALYVRIGQPGQPDEPLSARKDAAPGDIAVAVARIEAHLVDHPEDGRGFEVLAPVLLRMGRASDAVNAYRAALRTLGDTAVREAALGQAIAMAADGVVTAESRAAFDRALDLDPKLPQARFFVALGAEQDGDKGRAGELWKAFLADTPADAPWRPSIEKHLASVAGPAAAGLAAAPDLAPPAGPAAAAIAALPSDERLQAIRGMVDGLAARLAQNGRDLDGWLRLVKSYTVLGEAEKARKALDDAHRILADDPASLARLDAAARELGVGG